MNNRITYQTIVSAKSGDAPAMVQILAHYAPYIQLWSKGDYWIYQEAQAKLMYAITESFQI